MPNDDIKAKISERTLIALDSILLQNRKATSFGFLFGIVVLAFRELLSELNAAFSKVAFYGYPLAGVLIFNIPNMFRKHNINPSIESSLRYLKKIHKDGNYSEEEKRLNYRALVQRIIDEYQHQQSPGKSEQPDNPIDLPIAK